MGLVAVRRFDVHVSGVGKALDGFRMAHLSDLHFRRWNPVLDEARELLGALEYDALAVTGDFAEWPHRWPRAVEMMKRFFEPAYARGTVYATLGNHDHERIADDRGDPIRFLRDESVVLEHGAGRVRLAGVDQLVKRGGDVRRALGPSDDLPTVLLAHYPSTAHRIEPDRVGLQLSGHTHGGQWRFPGIGCLWGNDRIHPRQAWGLHRIRWTQVHVSAGIGTSLPVHTRINCPPEITVLTLRTRVPAVRSGGAVIGTERQTED